MSGSTPGPHSSPRRRPRRRWFRRRLGRRLRAPFQDVGGNSVEPLGPDAHYYDRITAAIDAAQRSVDVEMYLWDDDEVGRRFVDALAQAARRGARVRVLVDAHGSLHVIGLLAAVTAAGGDVRVFNPLRIALWRKLIHRTHRKLVVVDGAVAFTGGAGFSLFFSGGKHRERPWMDRMFEVRGPVLLQLATLFDAEFERWDPLVPRDVAPDATVPVLPLPHVEGPATIRVLRGWPDPRDFRPLLLAAIRGAKERVWIGTPYFLPSHSVRKALYDAARRGVDVRVIHPALPHCSAVLYYAVRARYGRWLKKKVRIAEYEPCFYHAKTLVVDRTLAVVGSSNFDSWSWRRNAEMDLAISDAATVDRIAALLADDRTRCREVTREDARVRTLVMSMRQTFGSWIEGWL